MRAHVSGTRRIAGLCSRSIAAAALDELLHVLRDDAPAWTTADGLRDVHSSICCQPPGVRARHHSGLQMWVPLSFPGLYLQLRRYVQP